MSTGKRYATGKSAVKNNEGLATAFSGYDDGASAPAFATVGWLPGCTCTDGEAPPTPAPCLVCDPFAGAGTTGIAAVRLGRSFVGFDLAGGDCDLGGHTANQRIAAAERGLTLKEYLKGQTSLLEAGR